MNEHPHKSSSIPATNEVAASSLTEDENRYRDMMELATDVVFELDAQLKFTFVSAVAPRVIGMAAEDVLGNTGTEIVHALRGKLSDDAVKAKYQHALENHLPFRGINYEISMPDGTRRYVELRGKPIFDKDGKFVGYRGTCTDHTEWRVTDMALRASEESFRNIIESSLQGIMVHVDFKPVFVNQTFVDMFGYDSVEEVLSLESVLLLYHPEDRERLRTLGEARFRGETVPQTYEYDGLSKDGSRLYLYRTAKLIDWYGQHAILHVAADISERKHAEEALRQAHDKLEEKVTERTKELEEANEQLKELDRLKSMFIASMSHELRTPLNAIIGFTSVVVHGMSGDINERQKDQLSRVYSAAHHLLALISDVIDISKIESGRIDVFPEPTLVYEIVDEAAQHLRSELVKKPLELRVNVPKELTLATDRKRLLQSIGNLMSNAIKYSEHGLIQVDAGRDEEVVWIAVSDNGIGVSSSDRPKLFVPFERLDSHLKIGTPGTGLGLYLTKKLITELLEGAIDVKSEPGKGSRFELRLPHELKRNAKEHVQTT